MHHLGSSRSNSGGQRGGVLVMVALFTPVAILFVAFVVDVGNWFDHKRQLQVRADAGALATARAFNMCPASKASAARSIYQLAGQYGGASNVYTPQNVSPGTPSFPYPGQGFPVGLTPYNTSPTAVSASNNTYELVNSQTYADQTGAGAPFDSSVPSASADPCTAAMADVKITEENLPWYMQALHVPFINAHARIEVKTETSGSGFMPFSVANTAPSAVTVYIVNEDLPPSNLNSCQPGSYLMYCVNLTDIGSASPVTGELWSNTGGTSISITKPHMGAIVAVSGTSTNTTCTPPQGNTVPEVTCFGGVGSGWGGYTAGSLVHIQGYTSAGTGTYSSPLARSVSLSSASSGCSNAGGPDALYSTATVSCTFTLSAKLDLGSNPNPPGVTVTPIVGGATQTTQLSYNAGVWTGTATIPPNAQSTAIDLKVQCNPSISGAPCTSATTATCANDSSLCDVQRADAADQTTAAGVYSADVVENSLTQQNSFELCEAQDNNQCAHTLTFNVITTPGLSPGPIYTMNFASNTGSNQTGILGCDGSTSGNFERTDIQFGCSGTYAINTTDYPKCANLANTGPSPWDCLPANSGIKEGPFFQGLNARLEPTGSCTNPNNYANYPNISTTDPRVIKTFVVPYNFVASGVSPMPILRFAAFYITGWDNTQQKSNDPCKNFGDDPAGKDQVVGHFINWVDPGGGSGGGPCVIGTLTECVAILTQ